jgi:ferrochelatase
MSDKVGVLLVNLGTPDATDFFSIRRYLSEFLSDRRVIETNSLIWQPILQGIILTIRPTRSGRAYQKIWNTEKNESPLRTITRSQSEALADRFKGLDHVIVDWAMRYGTPSIASRLDHLIDQGCGRIVLLPLYPQYSATTTASVNDKAFSHLQSLRVQPAIRTVPAYPTHPSYISALAQSIDNALAVINWVPQLILASFHGLPKSYVDKGDPYQRQCEATLQALRQNRVGKLGGDGETMRLVYQSRVGRQEWLQPYVLPMVKALPSEGITDIAVFTPGFAADCIETLEEISMELREEFLIAGGKNFTFIPCLNDSDIGIDMLETLTRDELAGWAI